MTLKSGAGQACAACKYQRRRCVAECPLAPYFPADDPKTFQNVHRLFGVKHIQNTIKETPPDLRGEAVFSIKYHAAMREKYPVSGCLHEINSLCYCINTAREELAVVMQQLALFRQQQQQQQHNHHHQRQDQLATFLPSQLGMNNNIAPGNSTNTPMAFFVQQEVTHNNLTTSLAPHEAFGNRASFEAVENNESNAFDYSAMHVFLDQIDDRLES